MLVHLYQITPKHAFGTPRIEPAWCIPIIRAGWKSKLLDPDNDVEAVPVPFARDVSSGADEYDRLARDYGKFVAEVFPTPHFLEKEIRDEAAKLKAMGMVAIPAADLPAGTANPAYIPIMPRQKLAPVAPAADPYADGSRPVDPVDDEPRRGPKAKRVGLQIVHTEG